MISNRFSMVVFVVKLDDELYRISFQGQSFSISRSFTSRVCCISWEMLFMDEWDCLPASL